MLLRWLAFMGRHGAAILAGGLFIGLVLPPLAALLRPLLTGLIFVLTAATLLGIEWRALRGHLRHPGRIALVLGWTLVAVPVLVDLAGRLGGLPAPLVQALVLWAAAPPLSSLPAIAILLGLDPALALIAMVAGIFLVPFTLPPLVLGLIGLKLEIGIAPLMLHLLIFVGGATFLAAVLRRLVGRDRLRRHATALGGVNVILMLLFAIAITDGADGLILAQPDRMLLYAASALVTSAVLQGVGSLLFLPLERRSALTIGLVGGNHNLSMVWASLGAAATPDLMLFLICVQVPIYVLPAALRPVYRRLGMAAAVTPPSPG